MYRLLYVLGTGHCGSTLFNYLLNGHNHMVGLSEVYKLGLFLQREDPTFDDAFWTTVADEFERSAGYQIWDAHLDHASGRQIKKWPSDRLRRYVDDNVALFDCIHRATGSSVLVDSSKAWQRLYLLARYSSLDIRVIHLVRDGRAVVNSYGRKYESFFRALVRWAVPSMRVERVRRLFTDDEWMTIKYEDLCAHPGDILRAVCRFVGLQFQSDMLEYRSHRYIGVGGNRMRQESGTSIELDERWKTEMPFAHRQLFRLLGGWLNARVGYDSQ